MFHAFEIDRVERTLPLPLTLILRFCLCNKGMDRTTLEERRFSRLP